MKEKQKKEEIVATARGTKRNWKSNTG